MIQEYGNEIYDKQDLFEDWLNSLEEEEVVAIWNEHTRNGDDKIYPMEEFDEYCNEQRLSPTEIIDTFNNIRTYHSYFTPSGESEDNATYLVDFNKLFEVTDEGDNLLSDYIDSWEAYYHANQEYEKEEDE